MAQITSGSVYIEDGLKKNEEYAPPRKVSVTLNFGVAEGEDYQGVFDLASQAARNRVNALLHGKQISVAVDNTAEQASAAPAAETTTTRKKRRTAAEIEADETAKRAAAAKDPADIGDDFSIEGDGPAEALPSEAEDFSIEPEIEEITDAALNAAVQRKNAELSDPEAIRGLIKQYNPDPTKAFQLREIPADKRADFVTKLAGLTKASA